MPGRDRIIDPVTRDYVKNGVGSYETTATIGTRIYHQLQGKRGFWWGDSTHGSDIHEGKHHGVGQAGIIFHSDAVKTALSSMIRSGLARDLRVVVTAVDSRICINSSVVDIQGALVATEVNPFSG